MQYTHSDDNVRTPGEYSDVWDVAQRRVRREFEKDTRDFMNRRGVLTSLIR